MKALLEIVRDPATFLLVLAFWARWERWRSGHVRQHEELQKLVPHEVDHHG